METSSPVEISAEDAAAIAEALASLVRERLEDEAWDWFARTRDMLRTSKEDRTLYIALGLAPRRLGKEDLLSSSPSSREIALIEKAAACRAGWSPRHWSVDQAARVVFLLTRYHGEEGEFFALMERLFRTADVGELICFYQALPLYPGQALYLQRAREGARTNMRPVFEAVAHRNPYPRERFDEEAWNQMVLKALFIESRLDPILGLDERANPELARMLLDYAHERWAAGRPVSPELWRCVGPFARDEALEDLGRVLDSDDPLERMAASLALAASPDPRARRLLEESGSEFARAALAGQLSWSGLAARMAS